VEPDPFLVVSGVGRGMGVLDGGGYHRREVAVLGMNFGRPIVTNEDILSSLCKSDTLFRNYFGKDLL